MPAYGTDLAYIHHTGFGDFARSAAPEILDTLNRAGISSGLIVDLGCGSGIWARQLLRSGYEVLGVDISPGMIALAKKNAPGARFRVASLLEVEIPPCAAVTAIGECLNYAFDSRARLPALSRLFKRIFSALLPGGIFIFDVAAPGRVGPCWSRREFVEGKDWVVFSHSKENDKHKTLTRRITTFRKIGKYYRHSVEVHKLKLYEPAELVAALRRKGFTVRMKDDYGAFRLHPRLTVIIARKPAINNVLK